MNKDESRKQDDSPERPLFSEDWDERDTLRALVRGLHRSERLFRRRIAEVLHDPLQQILADARSRTRRAEARTEPGEARQSLAEAGRLLDQASKLARDLCLQLDPGAPREEDLPGALRWLAGWVEETHGVSVRFEQEGQVGPVPEELRLFLFEAVQELLFNVDRHSGARQAAVRLGSVEDGRLRIRVEDGGAGFNPDALPPMGEGGFGLFSLRERLQLIGGRLDLDSRPGAGTRVSLSVPLGETRDVEPAGAGFPVTRVLVVDDHKIMRDGIIAMLSPLSDIQVVGEAADGREAVELARELEPDVILMDVSMPEMNGIEATRLIIAERPGVRIVALSMFDDAQIAESMRRAGAVDYLTKGDQTDELVSTIRASR